MSAGPAKQRAHRADVSVPTGQIAMPAGQSMLPAVPPLSVVAGAAWAEEKQLFYVKVEIDKREKKGTINRSTNVCLDCHSESLPSCASCNTKAKDSDGAHLVKGLWYF